MTSQYCVKLVMLGEISVGKRSLSHKFTTGDIGHFPLIRHFYSFESKEINLDTKGRVELQIWECPVGFKKRFQSLQGVFYKAVSGAIIVFDLTQIETYESVPWWISNFRDNTKSDVPFILVGNKTDLVESTERPKPPEKPLKLAQDRGGKYLETSAKTGLNVIESFTELARVCVKKVV